MCHPDSLRQLLSGMATVFKTDSSGVGVCPAPLGLAPEEGEWPSLLLFSMEGRCSLKTDGAVPA